MIVQRDVGDRSVFTWTVENEETGVPYNPPIMLVKVKPYGGTEVTYRYGVTPGFTNPSTGAFRIEIPWTSTGQWKVRFEALSDALDVNSTLWAEERTCTVKPTAFSNPILPDP